MHIHILLIAKKKTPQKIHLLIKCICTSLYDALFSLCARKSVNEVCESTVAAEQLLVRTTFCDFSVRQNEDEVSLWQEAHPMGHKYAGLLSTPQQREREKTQI